MFVWLLFDAAGSVLLDCQSFFAEKKLPTASAAAVNKKDDGSIKSEPKQ